MTLYESVPDFKYQIPGEWSFVRCVDCGLVYLHPRLADQAGAYPEEYSQHTAAKAQYTPRAKEYWPLRKWIRAGVLRTYGYKSLAKSCFPKIVGGATLLFPWLRLQALYTFLLFPEAEREGKILDIGCGNGRFLAVMQKLGWNVYGVEPDSYSAKLAREQSRGPVYPTLQDAHFSTDFFDIVTMNHVFEHVENPVEVSQECYRILKPGGRIGICVPNWKSLSRRVFGKYCYHLEPPRHVVCYEPCTLKGIIEQAGFTIRSIRTTSVREKKVSFQKSWFFKARKPAPRLLVAAWDILSPLVNFVSRETGEEIVLWAVKHQ
jgi:2-polyprenyl-3-methyl-5-hydroxy-6-metoxy-1,4-benzoquinol methylase